MKRVLQINKFYHPYIGGIEHTVQQIAEGLADDIEMSVLVCSDSRKKKVEYINGVSIIRVPIITRVGNLPFPLGLIKTLRNVISDIDVIHLHMPFPFGDLACLLSGFTGKIIVSWHSDVVRQKRMMQLYKPIMNKMLKRADVIIVATEGHINGSSYLKPYKNKCICIPFGVDETVEKRADKYFLNRKETNLEMEVRFLFIGRLVYYKGCKILLEAFANVKCAKLVLAGTGTMLNELRALAQQLNISNNVEFLGEVSEEEKCNQLELCDVFVLPSILKSEAFGLVQIEAMAFGKPVINTNLPSGVPYVSLDKITGLTVPPGDIESLSQAMQWMVDHEFERIQMGENARQRMKEHYKMKFMLDKLLEVYES